MVLGTAVAACIEAEHLSQTGQKAVVFLPAMYYTFGNVQVGTGSATNPDPYFTIRAQSQTDNDYVTSVAMVQPGCGSDFSLDLPAATLPYDVYCSSGSSAFAGGSTVTSCTYVDYDFGATFHPSQSGAQTCEVDVSTMPSGSTTVTVTPVYLYGSGVAASYSMAVNPTSIDFGDVPLGTTSGSQGFQLVNNGGQPFMVTGANSDPTHFLVTPSPTGPFSLPVMGFQPFGVQCQAGSTAAPYQATVTFSTASTQGGLTKAITLTCNAAATSVTASPNPVNLGTHLIGDGGQTTNVTITNIGGTAVTLGNFRFAGTPGTEVTYAGTPSTIVLGAGSGTNIAVTYVPASERDFGPLGSMVFDANGTATTVPLVGGAHTGSIGTNPAALDFGTVCAGSTASLDLAVFANAGGDIKMAAPTGPGAPFSAALGSGMPPITLMAHHANEATITTTAAPAMGATPGDAKATLMINTNIPGGAMVPIDVHALVLAGGVAPDKDVIHFGPNDVGKPSPVQMVTLTNCGASDITLVDVGFAGSNADEFAVVSPADVHVTIPKTKSQQFLILMNPKTVGAKTAQLDFGYPGGPSLVALDGTGIGSGDTGGTKDRETYYACSVGSPGGLIPLAAVGLLLRRRRRR